MLLVRWFCLVNILWSVIAMPAYAQVARQTFKHITSEQGLPQSAINTLFQDSRGFIWIGTQQGLFRYDGYTFLAYLHEASNTKSLSGNAIRSLYEDTEGNLWIGTEGYGLNRFNRQSENFVRVDGKNKQLSGIAENTVTAILKDKQGVLWIGTQSGLQMLEKGSLLPFPISAGAQTQAVQHLLEDKKGNLWIGTDQGLFQVSQNRQHRTHFTHQAADSASLSSNRVQCLFEDKQGTLWIGTHAGLNRFNPVKQNFSKVGFQASKNNEAGDTEIYSLAQDKEGNIWMGTFGNGLVKLNPKTLATTVHNHIPEDKSSISSDVILSLLIDRSGLLWAGTYEGILDQLNLLKTEFGKLTYQPVDTNSLASNEVYAILEDHKKRLWIGTDNGLSVYNQQTSSFTNLHASAGTTGSMSSNIVYSLLQDKQKNMWIGTADGGLLKLSAPDINKGVFNFEPFLPAPGSNNKLADDEILSLLEDKSGYIWVGTAKGLSVIDSKNRVVTYTHSSNRKHSLSDNQVLCLYEDRSGKVWVGTNKGLNQFNSKKRNFTRFEKEKNALKSLPYSAIYAIHEDAIGNLWLGTDDGLCRLNTRRDTATLYTVENGLPDNVVYGIMEDSAKNLWVSTNKGISKMKKNETGKPAFIQYNSSNWLHCNSFNIGAYHKSKSGMMYFGCNEGLTYFNPAAITGNTYAPLVVITDFQLFFEPVTISNKKESPLSKAITETEKLLLKYNQNVLYFEFAALNFIDHDKNEYAFFMQGFDKDWNYVKNKHNATYTNLDPGTYVFKVKASNNDGVWNEAGASIEIVIKPPFYRETWFYVLCTAGLIFSVVGYVHMQMREMQENERLLVQKVKERTEEVTKQKEELETTIENLKATQAQLVQAEKMASLGILTAGVAHEINNPINFVSANVEPLKRDIDDMLQVLAGYENTVKKYTLSEEFKEVENLKKELDFEVLIREINDLLKGIKEGASRTSEIVKGLRNFSRLDENEMKPVQVNEGIESTLLVLSNQLKNKIIVHKEYGKLENLVGYPGKLNQVFMNIISNACQAIPEKGEIYIKTFMDKREVVIRITDTGIGMTEEVKKRIFEPFFTTKKVGAGTGLGLFIAYGIIKDHNGKVFVESTPGKGTTFTIRLPVNA
ncbi:hypothetical protein GXP67_27140 [Rhodocytophaga rosea]|uniref:histidine kinase n=1 Tax=Rhodocytophaga rosea TaxID=2704465 RepID=A0A6C0GPR6_9BACT|nr:two-component regulator propeller domain-containing protein [Rhodocytophaga rosea]QHT70058.1 hypothetical protein GXP67_27140 [Rhodocytophaga rosea]